MRGLRPPDGARRAPGQLAAAPGRAALRGWTPKRRLAFWRGAAPGAARQRRLQALATLQAFSGSGGAALPFNTVKVYEAGRQASGKRIVAETVVQAPVDVVWRVLTAYERLAEFVPNLESSERLPSPRAGRALIRQRGCSQGVLWRLEAQATLEVEEAKLPLGRREARFTMLEGDFQEMNGRWVVEPDPSSAVGMATLLRFDVSVRPKYALPSAIVSYVVRAGLPANIQAVARRAEEIAANKLRVSGLARWAGTEDDPPIPAAWEQQQAAAAEQARTALEQEAAEEEAARAAAAAVDRAQEEQEQRRQAEARDEGLPRKGPFWSLNSSSFPEAAPLTAARQRQQQGLPPAEQEEEEEAVLEGSQRPLQRPQSAADPQSLYLGVVSVPLPPAGNRSSTQPQTQQELNQRQAEKERLQGTYPAIELRRAGSRSGSGASSGASNGASSGANGSSNGAAALAGGASPSGGGLAALRPANIAAAEVHLRRLDTFDTLHRRAVAAITIDAPPEAVWAVLTDYNRLSEFIPNLAVSQRIALPPSAPPNIIRVRQVGYKRMLYMCLHAESVLDLIEKPQSEIQFRQVAGDFERFQGKWMLQGVSPTGSVSSASSSSSSDSEASSGCTATQLKYAVEIVIPRATRMLGVLEPLLERTVFEDVPANLAAIKQRVETIQAELSISQLEAEGATGAAAALRRKLERPSLSEMQEDFNVLVAELERCFGEQRVLPPRNALREMNRSDLEKAISAHGGPSVVAQQLGWKLKAKGRRPKGYWDAPENVRAEVDEFIEEQGLPPGVMPAKNAFIRAGRYDIARAVERWGGLYELAEELGYAVGDSAKPGASEWQEHISEVAASTGLSGRQGLFKLAAKTYAARRSMQGSMDGDEAFALADVLAAADAGTLEDLLAAADGADLADMLAAEEVTVPVSAKPGGADDAGDGALAMSGSAAAAGSSSSSRGGASSGGGKGKARRQPAASRSSLSVREEIDAW